MATTLKVKAKASTLKVKAKASILKAKAKAYFVGLKASARPRLRPRPNITAIKQTPLYTAAQQ